VKYSDLNHLGEIKVKIRIEVFYSPTCSLCPKAKEILWEVLEKVNQKVYIDEVNVLSLDGLKKAEQYGVKTVPTMVINMKHKIVGVPSKENLLKIINDEIVKNKFKRVKN